MLHRQQQQQRCTALRIMVVQQHNQHVLAANAQQSGMAIPPLETNVQRRCRPTPWAVAAAAVEPGKLVLPGC
jgi:hypothetical protein